MKFILKEIRLSEIDKAWIAGFTDGEGWLGIVKGPNGYRFNSKRYSPAIRIYNTNAQIIDWLKDRMPFGYTYNSGNYRSRNIKHKSEHVFIINNCPRTLMFLDLIQPYLKLKVKQAELLRMWCLRRRENKSEKYSQADLGFRSTRRGTAPPVSSGGMG